MVSHPPMFHTFKPAGVVGNKLESIMLKLDEYEALELNRVRKKVASMLKIDDVKIFHILCEIEMSYIQRKD